MRIVAQWLIVVTIIERLFRMAHLQVIGVHGSTHRCTDAIPCPDELVGLGTLNTRMPTYLSDTLRVDR